MTVNPLIGGREALTEPFDNLACGIISALSINPRLLKQGVTAVS
jgi:hypothetical protein